MWQQIFLGFIGLCSGIIIAGGIAGLMIGLSIVPRYAGITHTADYILLYEDATLLGTVFGVVTFLFKLPLPLGPAFLAAYGFFFPVFFLGDGSWRLQKWRMSSLSSAGGYGSPRGFPSLFYVWLLENLWDPYYFIISAGNKRYTCTLKKHSQRNN